MMRAAAHRNHPAWWAFLLHRVSGVALALFLPVHLFVLGGAVGAGGRLDSVLRWSDQPMVKIAEAVLVVLLAAHLAGGLRLLVLEFVAWTEGQRAAIAVGLAAALGCGVLYLMGAL
jgi:fumarate reductase subunit D